MSKKNRQEFSQARDQQSDNAAFIAVASQHKRKSPSRTPEEIVQMERAERAAQEKSASYAVAGWPESLAEYRGFQLQTNERQLSIGDCRRSPVRGSGRQIIFERF